MKMGTDPDYRFSLANERTFLATSVGIVLLSASHDSAILRHSHWIAPGFAAVAMAAALWAFLRWYQNEKAMRLAAPFQYSKSLLIITVIMVGSALVIGYLAYGAH